MLNSSELPQWWHEERPGLSSKVLEAEGERGGDWGRRLGHILKRGSGGRARSELPGEAVASPSGAGILFNSTTVTENCFKGFFSFK